MSNPHERTAANPVLGVLGIFREGDRVLMIRRSAMVRVPLAWCFPGGGIEPGESQAEALVREMQEELAIDVEPGELLTTHTKHEGRLVLYCWSGKIGGGTLAANPKEVAEVRWMTPAEVRAMDGVLPGTTDILEKIGL